MASGPSARKDNVSFGFGQYTGLTGFKLVATLEESSLGSSVRPPGPSAAATSKNAARGGAPSCVPGTGSGARPPGKGAGATNKNAARGGAPIAAQGKRASCACRPQNWF